MTSRSFAGGNVCNDVTTPIIGVNAGLHPAMERRMGPIRDLFHMTLFHWMVVNIVQVPGVIRIIADGVFPKSPLPDPALHPQRARQGRLRPRPALLALGYSPLALAFTARHTRCAVSRSGVVLTA